MKVRQSQHRVKAKIKGIDETTVVRMVGARWRWSWVSCLSLSGLALLSALPTAQVYAWGRSAEKPIAQESAPGKGKAPISHEVYASWRSIQTPILSRDGQWAAYALHGQESDGELVVKNLRDGREWRAVRGAQPSFSYDGRYLAFTITPTVADVAKAKKEKKKPEDAPKPGMGWMNLATGQVESLERVKRFAFAEEGGSQLAVLLEAKKETKDNKEGKGSSTSPPKKDSVVELGDEDQMPSAVASTSNSTANAGAKKKKEAGTELILWDVDAGKKQSFQEVADFLWSRHGRYLAYTVSVKEPEKSAVKEDATEAIKAEVIPVAASAQANANVESSKAKVQEAVTDRSHKEGVYLHTIATAATKVLTQGAGTYKHLQFDDQGQQLAYLSNLSNRDALAKQKASKQEVAGDKEVKSDQTKTKLEEVSSDIFALYFWREGDAQASVLVDQNTAGMMSAWAPSEFAPLTFSEDGQRLFLSTAEIAKPEPKNAPEPMKVDLWHWKDPELQSVQKLNAEKDKQRNYRAVVHLADQRFVQLANKQMPQLVVNENAQFAMGVSSLPYRHLMSWDALYYDVYAVNLQNGQAKMLIEKSLFMPSLSPQGRYILQFDEKRSRWLAFSTQDGQKHDLTSGIKARFENHERDIPSPKSPYGVAGWRENDDSVVLYDQFDLWEVSIQSKTSRNLTAGYGRKNQIEFRYVPVAEQREPRRGVESKALPTNRAWILSADHAVKHDSGYFLLDPRRPNAPHSLIYESKMVAGLTKAKEAQTLLLTRQSFSEFPDLWTAQLDPLQLNGSTSTLSAMSSPVRVSHANPQQVNHLWGTQELMDYVSADGKKLKALVAKPENFDPKKKYPLMVYIYEKMTDNLHRYVPPAPAQNINVTRYVSNGYIVLRPDIVYETGYPGKSAMKTVIPAIEKLLSEGYVDRQRIGIQGHSWGAYQINYMLTRTQLFRAAEAGASMANMISGYGGIRWGAGISRAFQYERGQSRIGGTPWDSRDKYVENSPIFAIDKVTTPYLTVHNDDDDAVPWYQAIEFFTALRRLNKEAYWFNYNGEKHGLRDRDNIKHFTVHMSEFFDHYLLGKARPEWMDKPIPYLERGKRDVMGQFVPAKAAQ